MVLSQTSHDIARLETLIDQSRTIGDGEGYDWLLAARELAHRQVSTGIEYKERLTRIVAALLKAGEAYKAIGQTQFVRIINEMAKSLIMDNPTILIH